MHIKHYLAFLLTIIPCLCYGDEYDDVMQDSTFKYLAEYDKWVEHSLPVIEARIRQIDSVLVESTKNDTKEQKIVKYNNRLVQKVFDDYKNDFLADIEKKSKETGRKVKKEKSAFFDNGTRIWLDEGIMDTDQCKEHVCFYPDGFEEYDIDIDDDRENPYMIVSIDDRLRNRNENYEIDITNESDASKSGDMYHHSMLQVYKLVYDYNDNHRYRNQLQKAIRDDDFTCHSEEECSKKSKIPQPIEQSSVLNEKSLMYQRKHNKKGKRL